MSNSAYVSAHHHDLPDTRHLSTRKFPYSTKSVQGTDRLPFSTSFAPDAGRCTNLYHIRTAATGSPSFAALLKSKLGFHECHARCSNWPEYSPHLLSSTALPRRSTSINPLRTHPVVYVHVHVHTSASLASGVMHIRPSSFRLRPYHHEYTGSRPITAVKHGRARSVPGWVTAWEHLVL